MRGIYQDAKRSKHKERRGFTIVELLIVVVVISILAAITVVAYNGVTAQAHESALKSDLSTTAKKLNVEKVESGSFPSSPTFIPSELAYSGGGNAFCVVGTTRNKSFHVTQAGSVQEGECPPPATMQAMTSGYCSSMTVYNGSNPSVTLSLTDSRGGITRAYDVAKLADGKCWMLTNLKLGSTDSAITLTPADSNVASNFSLPQVVTGSTSGDNPRVFGPTPGDTDSSNTNYGYLYSWPAATAGATQASNPAGSGNATNSICPASWRLPTGGIAGEFAMLNAKMNNPNATAPSTASGSGFHQNWSYTGPFRIVFSGLNGAWAFGQGDYGRVWSRSVHLNDVDKALAIFLNKDSYLDLADTQSRSLGFSVRCIIN